MKKNLLITGGLGNLGSWIVEKAIQEFNVTVLTKNKRDINIPSDFEVVYADLSDKDQLSKCLKNKKFNYVIHAGSVNDGFVEGYSKLSYDVNAFGTKHLINIINHDFLEHFIYLSTFQVYGLYEGSIDENTIPTPKNDYGLSHLVAEYFISMSMREPSYSIIRLTNSYGCPKDYHSSKWYLVLNDLSQQAFLNKKIKLSGNGKSVRDFIWMGDVVKVLLKLLRLDPDNDIYNISQQEITSMLDVASIVQSAYYKYYGISIPIEINKNDNSSPPNSLAVSSKKIRSKINFDDSCKMKEEAIKIFKFLEKK